MSLFQCTECGCVENTACCHYWTLIGIDKKPPVCSACDPEIGKWHDRFKRMFLPKGMFETNKVGNLSHIETGDDDYRKYEIKVIV